MDGGDGALLAVGDVGGANRPEIRFTDCSPDGTAAPGGRDCGRRGGGAACGQTFACVITGMSVLVSRRPSGRGFSISRKRVVPQRILLPNLMRCGLST